MPKVNNPVATKNQRRFAKEYVKCKTVVEAAQKAYPEASYGSAAVLATRNLRNPVVLKLIEQQAEVAMLDQIAIRQELKKAKRDYNVRSQVNRDIMDRAGYKPVERIESSNLNLNMNVEIDAEADELRAKFEKELFNKISQ